MTRVKRQVTKSVMALLKELPELLADYEHLAPDSDGNIDPHRKKRIRRIGGLLIKIRLEGAL